MTSFLTSLESGVLSWDLLEPFPEQDPDDRIAGDEHVREIGDVLEARVDADLVDLTGALPDGLIEELQELGYLRLQLDTEDGGRELSMYNTFRVVERAAAHATPVGQILGLANGAGAGALLPVLPAGPLNDFVRARVRAGTVSGWADTEPTGQNNRVPATVAVPMPDGSGYRLSGAKVFTGNGTVADLILVTATIPSTDGPPRTCVCFVDTSTPGFRVQAPLEFMGSRGLPNGALSFDDVFVPRDRVLLAEDGGDIRQSPLIAAAGLAGRLYIAAAPALAVARLCLRWQRDFVNRRTIDGRGLGDYDAVQRAVAASVADVHTADSVLRWCLLDCGLADRWFERLLAKNIATMTAWRVVDRTLSLLGGEGYETARSKQRRGVPVLPVERALRDVRGMRVAGNVDFFLDYQAARLLLARRYQAAEDGGTVDSAVVDGGATGSQGADLSPANREHRAVVTAAVRRFADVSAELTARHVDPAALFADEHRLILLGRVAGELLTMTTVLARSTPLLGDDPGDAAQLADVYCTRARHRLDDLWSRLSAQAGPDHAKISRSWLSGSALDLLTTP